MAIEILARTRLLDPPQSATLALLVNGANDWNFMPDASSPSAATFVLRPGVHPLKRGFNRVVFEKPPEPAGGSLSGFSQVGRVGPWPARPKGLAFVWVCDGAGAPGRGMKASPLGLAVSPTSPTRST